MTYRFTPEEVEWVRVRVRGISRAPNMTKQVRHRMHRLANKFTNSGPLVHLNGSDKFLLRMVLITSTPHPSGIGVARKIGVIDATGNKGPDTHGVGENLADSGEQESGGGDGGGPDVEDISTQTS